MALVVVVEGYELIVGVWPVRAVVGYWILAVGLSAVYQGALIERAVHPMTVLRRTAVDIVLLVFVGIFLVAGQRGLLSVTVFVRQAIVLVRVYMATEHGARTLLQLLAQPAKLLAVSFIGVIILGTLFLSFPRATADGKGAPLIDAAFTATSATCVTGLAVLNTNDDPASNSALQSFTTFGQVVLFVLIQIGGLGIMTLSAAVVLLLGRRLGMRSQVVMQSVMEEGSRRDLEHSIRYIVTMTFVIELVGAALLFLRFEPALGDARLAASYALFMSVSAYCNAGFSLWSDSLTSFSSDWYVMSVIMALITFGGLGFTVVAALVERDNLRRTPQASWNRWPAHVKIVLSASFVLTVGGAIVFYFFEFGESLTDLSRGDKLMASLFQSVTMRTAGFNTVDLGALSRVTVIIMVLLMFVGGSSGSTAGGVKTSTVAVVGLSVKAMLFGRDDVEAWGRTIPKSIVYKSVSILTIFVVLFVFGLIGLLIVEPNQPFMALLFETMSALATVGVSQGITPELGTGGKLLVIFLMFVGRIGPLTLALAVGERAGRVALRYPEGKIMVG